LGADALIPSASQREPLVVVMGDFDLVRPLVLARIPCAAVAPEWDPVQWSRHLRARLPWIDPWERPDEVVDALLAFARKQPSPPVLMPQGDADLLLVSRHRGELAGAFRFILPEPELVEALADKASFAMPAERLQLPAPRTRHVLATSGAFADLDCGFRSSSSR
jgi:predicted ATP-grasp superfamily ATP-dependent carboligase